MALNPVSPENVDLVRIARQRSIADRIARQARRHNKYERKRLSNAKASGQGERETQRRRRQIGSGKIGCLVHPVS